MDEEWKDIPGYEGAYQVSSEGNVRSLDRKCIAYCHKSKEERTYMRKGRMLSKISDGRGYYRVCLGADNPFHIYRLVALAFIPNPENKPTVDHINRISTDDRVINLRWATYAEQNLNRYHKPGILGYKNIRYEDGRKRYIVAVKRNAIKHHVGRYKTLQEAITARDNYLDSLE